MRIPQMPALGARYFQTFTAARPKQTHWRKATCEEIECEQYLNGWWTIVPVGSDQERAVFEACSGADGFRRHAIERPDEADGPGLRAFWFPAGNPCFLASQHQVPLERPEIFYVRDGDLRRSLGRVRRFDRADQWQEEWNDRMDKLTRL